MLLASSLISRARYYKTEARIYTETTTSLEQKAVRIQLACNFSFSLVSLVFKLVIQEEHYHRPLNFLWDMYIVLSLPCLCFV